VYVPLSELEWGSPNSNDWRKRSALCLHCGTDRGRECGSGGAVVFSAHVVGGGGGRGGIALITEMTQGGRQGWNGRGWGEIPA
jgi:hypothetical protein